MNFCVDILTLKIEEKQHFQNIMHYCFKKGKNTPKICAVCGEGVVTDQTCQKWSAKFRAGDFLLDDAPQLGGAVEVDRNQIKTLIERNQCCTTWEILLTYSKYPNQ